MTNPQWPGQPGQPHGQSPWAQADPRWEPQTYQDAAARDPRQPFGAPAGGQALGASHPPHGAGPAIGAFQTPPPNRAKPLLIAGVVVGGIAALLVALQVVGGGDDGPTPQPRPSASGSADDPRSTVAATSGTSIPFEGNGNGTFEVLSQRWTDDSLVVRFKVTMDQGAGTKSFTLYAFNNDSMAVVDPTDTTPFNVSDGTPYEGTVTFPLKQGKATVVLATGSGRALTALRISG